MALTGLPAGNSGEAFLDSIRYDAKAGKWHRADRAQSAAGTWETSLVEMPDGTAFAADMENIEIGWIAFAAAGPDFKMVANGQDIGTRPTDLHKAGFRLKVLLRGETAPRYFASTAKSVTGVIDELHTQATAKPGVAVLRIKGTKLIETKGPTGTTRNYAPVLEIVQHIARPVALGGTSNAPVSPPEPKPEPKPAPQPTAEVIGEDLPF